MRSKPNYLSRETPLRKSFFAIHGANRITGFSLIELMIVLAIIGILSAVAIPAYHSYVVRAKLTEGLSLFGALKPDIATYYADTNNLPATFEDFGKPAATGTANGGDADSFEHFFGFVSDIWRSVELQPKAGGMVLVLRSYEQPLWGNIDLGLHFQIKQENGNLRFRCTANESMDRLIYMPASCRVGSVDEWDW